jgi:hypothetical protein
MGKRNLQGQNVEALDAVAPQGRPWMWASGHNGDIKRTAHGYEPSCARLGSTLRTLSLAFHIAPCERARKRQPQALDGRSA